MLKLCMALDEEDEKTYANPSLRRSMKIEEETGQRIFERGQTLQPHGKILSDICGQAKFEFEWIPILGYLFVVRVAPVSFVA